MTGEKAGPFSIAMNRIQLFGKFSDPSLARPPGVHVGSREGSENKNTSNESLTLEAMMGHSGSDMPVLPACVCVSTQSEIAHAQTEKEKVAHVQS